MQSSANYVEGALRNYRADTVFLGIAGLARQDDAFQRAYWNELVHSTGARRVLPIHWDDFRLPLDEPLVPMLRMGRVPPGGGDFEASMEVLLRQARPERVDVNLLQAWTPVDPFKGS